jgi:hypothetical protein
MPINKIKLMDGKTTIHEAHGDITFNELLIELIDYYESHLTLNCIWDFTNASISTLSKEDIHALVEKGSQYSKRRIGGKTAWVAADKFTFGICRMTQILGHNKNIKLKLQVFYSKAKALRWMDSEES